MCAQCDLARQLNTTRPAAEMMVRTSRTVPRANWSSVIDEARQATEDQITDAIAVNLILRYAIQCDIRPTPGMLVSFEITDIAGRPVPVDTAPPITSTTARMVTAIAAADLVAARDVYQAFVAAHPDQVTEFLMSTLDKIHDRRRRTCHEQH